MTENAGLAWKLRGYPLVVNHKCTNIDQMHTAIDWCSENLDNGTYVWAGSGQVVFSDLESATLFQLAWCYDR